MTVGENVPASEEDAGNVGSISSQEDPLEEEMATHSSILGETIPRTEEPARLQSMWLKEPDMTELASKKKKKKDFNFLY